MLRQVCPSCSSMTIARRLIGHYVGSMEKVKLWECAECYHIWSSK